MSNCHQEWLLNHDSEAKNHHAYLFFQLLRYSIGASDEFPQIVSSSEWNSICSLAAMHSLSGVIFYGIQKSGVKPPFELLMQWVAESEIIRSGNEVANKTVLKVSKYFEKRGFRGCILKGQGNTLNYPDPYIRACGDIDIWLEGGREKIMNMVDERWPGSLARYHHVEIPAVDGVPVEVHFYPSYMRVPWRNKRLQRWFKEQSEKQFANRVTLPNMEEHVSIPTVEFNVIYQLQHMFSHLFTEGFGLRQVVDYYYVLKSQNEETSKYQEVRDTLKYLGLYKFAGAIMWVMKEVLCLDDKYMIAAPNEKEGRFLLSEIMQSGNMGHYDTRLGKTKGEGIVHRYFRMTLRNLRFIQHYPEEALCEPIFRTWHFFWRMAH